MKKAWYSFLFLFVVLSVSAQYMRQQGQEIIDHNGQPIILRGMGLGGWMVQEGYMLQTDAFAGPQHKIREKITQLIGETNTETFYQAYRDNGITKRDIDSLKAWGFNSVRLPMHYNLYTLPIEQETGGNNTWLEEGFERTDELLQWCADNQMYLILDMHATPGGQGKDANISDYDTTKPSLWESQANRNKLVALWRKLADRYKNNPWIGGYDLINEPNWNFSGTNQNGCDEAQNGNGPLRALYVQITNAIREVDTNHMIILGGNCWGNNYNGMFPLWDNNMVLSFHKYWNANNQGAIQGILNLRTTHNVPLWLGESGENSNVWFRDAIALCEQNNIGWAWWPLKKIDNIAGPASVTKTPQYQTLLNYWQNGGTQPTQTFAFNALMQMAENYKMQHITFRPDVVDAMFRQVQNNTTKKYKNHPIPGKVFATEFDMGTNGIAYHDTDVANYRTDTGTFEPWNHGWAMRNDGVDIQGCSDAVNNGFEVFRIQPREWLAYTLTAPAETAYDIDIRYSGLGGKLRFEDANGIISQTLTFPATANATTYQTVTLTDVLLNAGDNVVKLYFETGGFNVNWFELKNPRPSAQAAFKVVNASTTILGDKIQLVFNKPLQTGINFSQSNFTLKVNGNPLAITSVSYDTTNNRGLIIVPAVAASASANITLTYSGSNITATDATVQATFTDMPVVNRTGNIIGISGTVQAENFYAQSGLQLETTQDTGGGQNIGYTDPGDYLEYLVDIAQAGNHRIEYRVSSQNQSGSVKLELINDSTQEIHQFSLPVTGAWQNWQTAVTQSVLPQGRYYLRLTVLNGGFNLNWIRFSYMAPDDDNDNVPNDQDLCPNTPAGDVVDFNGCTIFSMAANNFSVLATGESCRSSNNGSIAVSAVANHNYTATLTGNGLNQNQPFTQDTNFGNLVAGTYQLCITLAAAPTYQQCFDLQVVEPADLSVFSRVNMENHRVALSMEGGSVYEIELNGLRYMTHDSEFELDLEPGENTVSVITDRQCQGAFRKTIFIDDLVSVYPNPEKSGLLFIALPSAKQQEVHIDITSMLGQQVLSGNFQTQERKIGLNTQSLAAGVYAIKVTCSSKTYNSKFIKQ